MSKKKPTSGGRARKKTEVSLVRSSAAEYLTFVAAGGDSEASVEMRYEDENVWLTQKMMASLYDVSTPAINQHLKRIFSDNGLAGRGGEDGAQSGGIALCRLESGLRIPHLARTHDHQHRIMKCCPTLPSRAVLKNHFRKAHWEATFLGSSMRALRARQRRSTRMGV